MIVPYLAASLSSFTRTRSPILRFIMRYLFRLGRSAAVGRDLRAALRRHHGRLRSPASSHSALAAWGSRQPLTYLSSSRTKETFTLARKFLTWLFSTVA